MRNYNTLDPNMKRGILKFFKKILPDRNLSLLPK